MPTQHQDRNVGFVEEPDSSFLSFLDGLPGPSIDHDSSSIPREASGDAQHSAQEQNGQVQRVDTVPGGAPVPELLCSHSAEDGDTNADPLMIEPPGPQIPMENAADTGIVPSYGDTDADDLMFEGPGDQIQTGDNGIYDGDHSQLPSTQGVPPYSSVSRTPSTPKENPVSNNSNNAEEFNAAGEMHTFQDAPDIAPTAHHPTDELANLDLYRAGQNEGFADGTVDHGVMTNAQVPRTPGAETEASETQRTDPGSPRVSEPGGAYNDHFRTHHFHANAGEDAPQPPFNFHDDGEETVGGHVEERPPRTPRQEDNGSESSAGLPDTPHFEDPMCEAETFFKYVNEVKVRAIEEQYDRTHQDRNPIAESRRRDLHRVLMPILALLQDGNDQRNPRESFPDISDHLKYYIVRLVFDANTKGAVLQKMRETLQPPEKPTSKSAFTQEVVRALGELISYPIAATLLERKWIAWADPGVPDRQLRAIEAEAENTPQVRARHGFRNDGNQFGVASALLGKYIPWNPTGNEQSNIFKGAEVFLDFVKTKKGASWDLRVIARILAEQHRRKLSNHLAKWCAAVLFTKAGDVLPKMRDVLKVWLDDILPLSPKGKKRGRDGSTSPSSSDTKGSRFAKQARGAAGAVNSVLSLLRSSVFRLFRNLYAAAGMVLSPLTGLLPSSVTGRVDPKDAARKALRPEGAQGVSSEFLELFGRLLSRSDALDDDDGDDNNDGGNKRDAFKAGAVLSEICKAAPQGSSAASLKEFVLSEAGKDFREELVSLATSAAEREVEKWFGLATNFVCYDPQMPFAKVLEGLTLASGSRTYWWIDIFSNFVGSQSKANASTRMTSSDAVRATDNFTIVIDKWQDPAVGRLESCRHEIALAVDERKPLRVAMSQGVRRELDRFSRACMSAKNEEKEEGKEDDDGQGPGQDDADVDADFDELGTSLGAHGKRLVESKSATKQVDLKTRLAIISVVLEPAMEMIRQHKGNVDPSRMLNAIEANVVKGNLDVVDAANAFVALAPAYVIQGKTEEGIRMLRRIMDRVGAELRAEDRPSRRRLADLENVLGRALFSIGRFYCDSFSGDETVACADLCCDEAIAILRRCDDPLLAKAQYVLARTLVNCHMSITTLSSREREPDVQKSEKALDEAIRKMEEDKVLQPDLGALYVHRAKLLDLKNADPAEVEADFERALEVQVELYGPMDPRVALTTKCRGQSWYWRGKYEKALFHWGQAFPRICDGYKMQSISAFHVFKIFYFTAMAFDKLRQEKPEMANQEMDFVKVTAEKYFVELREKLRKNLEGSYPTEARRCDEVGYDWVASALRRVLVIDADETRAAQLEKALVVSDNVDVVKDVEAAQVNLQKHVYAIVFAAGGENVLTETDLALEPTPAVIDGTKRHRPQFYRYGNSAEGAELHDVDSLLDLTKETFATMSQRLTQGLVPVPAPALTS
ncbi:Hypothetical Protein FCC1311_056652 [Hondaea fermentalgiana]|uniref:Uncharacterized protein n=1 Tax=Hondaea fermentalgiana TaxID=2315210 RepID=A0A2R5GNJ6_9STRA|nr:Hypothetical Protein FCC1311_056652 [Hondaea fermentalgiana]|eukprot:GBG29444.1 Hypothetical Protein FCC1311_056652 [Hondaea fermentalgiana]